MKEYQVEITGITPLLQNKPDMYGFSEQFVEKKASHDWEKEALKKLYTNNKDEICQPSIHIERALIEAGKKLKVKNSGKATYSKLMGSMVSITPDMIPHDKQDYEINESLVVIPSTKGRIMCRRPMLKEWKLNFTIQAEEEIPSDALKECLELAGKYSGIGDWRPQKKGKFGKFQVTRFQSQEER